MEKTPVQLYREREKRVTEAIEFRIPDRVPVMLELSYFPAKYTGITCEAAFYDYEKWLNACIKTVRDFEPDIVQVTQFFPGIVYEILDSKQMVLPGHGVSPDHTHRFIEGEFMKADEYDDFMDDRSDFMLRNYLPRIFGALEPLNKLPPFWTTTFSYAEVPVLAEMLASPEIHGALEKLLDAGREMAVWHDKRAAFTEKIEELGFPLHGTRGAHIPFDFLSYHVRGMKGMYLDVFRQPDKLIEVFDKMLPIQIKKAIMNARSSGRKRVFWALHRGADGFLSKEQFERFYWPYAKKIVQALVDEGLTPCLFLEGDYTSRLEYFLELPRGKVLGRFDASDIRKVKEVLHGHMSIMGNVPSSMLETGNPGDVEDYCKNLIDVAGKGGGLIVAPRSTIDGAKPENIRAMVDFTKEYGRYS
ncbi:uroporphyrinogen decarboxylase family protein [Chloroflexota bacterium]